MTLSPVARSRWMLAALVLLVMGRTLWCDWTWWDDHLTLHQNRQMSSVGLDTFIDNWLQPTADIYIPLTYTVWGLVAMAAHVPPDPENITLNPALFHATNLCVHLAGALAAFALLRRLVRDDRAAFLGAALWAVHPVQVESVAWISGLKDVLAGTLVLVGCTLYVRWRQEGRAWAYWTALGVYILALLAKPSAFTTPLLLVAFDTLLLRVPWRKVAVAMVPFAMATVPIAVIAKRIQPAMQAYAAPWLRPFVVGDSIAFYVLKVLAPLQLTYDYGHNIDVIRASGELWFGWLLPAAIIAGVAAWAWRRRRAGRPVEPLPVVGLTLFVLAPLHVLGFTQFDFQFYSNVADHYLYVAMIGPALLLAWAVHRFGPRAAVAAAVLIAIYGVRAAWQTTVWQDSPSLNDHCLAVNPRSWVSYINDAGYKSQSGNFDGVAEDLETALRLQPVDLTANMAMMNLQLNNGDFDAADRTARRVLDLYASIWGGQIHGMTQPYLKVAGSNVTALRLDAAIRYLDEGLTQTPGDPGLLRLKQQIEWMKQDPKIHAATTSPAKPTTTLTSTAGPFSATHP